MALNLVKQNKARVDYGRVEDGAYPARMVQIIDLGKQVETDWKTGAPLTYEDSGEEIVKHKVWINFEFPDELIDVNGVDKPRWYGREYTVSAHEKSALSALLKAVDPKGVATEGGRNLQRSAWSASYGYDWLYTIVASRSVIAVRFSAVLGSFPGI